VEKIKAIKKRAETTISSPPLGYIECCINIISSLAVKLTFQQENIVTSAFQQLTQI